MTVKIIDVPESAATALTDDQGFGALETEMGVLPLKAMDVKTRITGLAYTTTLCQTFGNNLDQPMEATYIFPLPSRAAVSRFRFKVNGRVIDGVLKERGEARREYDQAIKDGHRAALAEEDRPSVFTMKVGNIMPGETAEVELDLNGQLAFCDGEAEFRFPLVVAPRYIPGAPLDGPSVGNGVEVDTDQVPDASRISPPVLLPGFPNPVQLGLEVAIDGAGLPVRNLTCSLHVVEQEVPEGGIQTVKLYPGERLNRDFILRFKVADEKIATSLTLIPDDDKAKGTFMLTLVPPEKPAQAVKPRDIVFLLDRSGSMSGWKMVCARRSLGRMVDTLTEHDRFQILAFDHSIEYPTGHRSGEWITGTDANRFRTLEWLGTIGAEGGTEIEEPLSNAVDLLENSEGRKRIIVLVTDGEVGNESGILKRLGKRLESIQVFTLGIDRAVNEGFLQRLASFAGGYCELIESEDRLDEVMERTHRRIGTPVLTDLKLNMTGAELVRNSMTPGRLPDLFTGAPAFISGRYKGNGAPGAITVSALADGGSWESTIDGHTSEEPAARKLWARWRIRDLEDQVDAHWGSDDLEKQITEISLRESVLCRYTAFIAVDRSDTANKSGDLVQMVQPVESPEGWDMMAVGGVVGEINCCISMDLADIEDSTTLSRASFRSGKIRACKSTPLFKKRSMLSSVRNSISGLFGKHSGSEPDVAEEDASYGADFAVLEDVVEALKVLFAEFKDALTKGTEELGAALWKRRLDLKLMADTFDLFGGDPVMSEILLEIADKLTRLNTQPDAARTVELWRKFESVMEALEDLDPDQG